MASSNKITIRVTTARRTMNVYWTSTGVEGAVNVGQTKGQLLGIPLTAMTSSDTYWNGIVTAVLAEIPA